MSEDIKKSGITGRKGMARNCESCEFYDYDEYTDTYCCQMDLDEDEMLRFLSSDTRGCPYYRYYDEYKSVHKQN